MVSLDFTKKWHKGDLKLVLFEHEELEEELEETRSEASERKQEGTGMVSAEREEEEKDEEEK